MKYSVAEKLLAKHSVGIKDFRNAKEIPLKIDQTLTQDATGTMAFLEFETIGVNRVKTELSVAYVDHNTMQAGFENADDHAYLRSVARKYGVIYSRAGNGICHQLHLEKFGKPGKTLLGSDSHTPTCGALGMLAIGAGGMDVAVAMAGGEYRISGQRIIKVNVTGRLNPYVSAKDVSLELLRLIGIKGGVNAIIEWGGEGLQTLSVPERATIANMGAETGATTTVFPSDEVTRDFLLSQGRGEDYIPIIADEGAQYDEIVNIDLSSLKPLIACPHSPGNVVSVSELAKENIAVGQVCIGSCTNSSLLDMLKVAELLKGKRIADGVSASVSPGSVFVLRALCGQPLESIISSGVRLLECACGPCIGMGFSPASNGVSVRTFNRNFLGRSGTKDASVYLASPETAVATALAGKIVDPTEYFKGVLNVEIPTKPIGDNGVFEYPLDEEVAQNAQIQRGKNIKECPVGKPPVNGLKVEVSIKTGDDITTDHIIPAGSKILPYRSNVPKLSQFCFSVIDEGFYERATKAGNSIIIGGENYGQGSSREHAALTLLHLGVRAVVAKSFARIHSANLINSGIAPLVFENADDYDAINLGDVCVLANLIDGITTGNVSMMVNGKEIKLKCSYTKWQQEILLAGGLLQYTGK